MANNWMRIATERAISRLTLRFLFGYMIMLFTEQEDKL